MVGKLKSKPGGPIARGSVGLIPTPGPGPGPGGPGGWLDASETPRWLRIFEVRRMDGIAAMGNGGDLETTPLVRPVPPLDLEVRSATLRSRLTPATGLDILPLSSMGKAAPSEAAKNARISLNKGGCLVMVVI